MAGNTPFDEIFEALQASSQTPTGRAADVTFGAGVDLGEVERRILADVFGAEEPESEPVTVGVSREEKVGEVTVTESVVFSGRPEDLALLAELFLAELS